MKFFKSRLLLVVGLLFSSFFALAQEQMTLADYQQAADYAYSNLWNKKVFNVKCSHSDQSMDDNVIRPVRVCVGGCFPPIVFFAPVEKTRSYR